MTGMGILRQAYSLLEQPERLAEETGGEDGLLAVNQIYSELWHREHRTEFQPLMHLRQTLQLSWRFLPAMAYGTAMLLCLNSGEDRPYDRYLELYRRAASYTGGCAQRRLYAQPTEEATA